MASSKYGSSKRFHETVRSSKSGTRNNGRIGTMSRLSFQAQVPPVEARLVDFIGIVQQQCVGHVNLRSSPSQLNCEPLPLDFASPRFLDRMVHYRARDRNDGGGRRERKDASSACPLVKRSV